MRQRSWSRGLCAVPGLVVAVASFGAVGQSQLAGRIEVLAVRSITYSGSEFLVGRAAGKQVLLGGELRLPVGAPPRVPAVVLVHGSGGVGPGVDAWARAINEAGMLTWWTAWSMR